MAEDAKPKTKKIIITKVVDGKEQEVEIEVPDVEGLQWLPRGAHRLIGKRIPRLDGPDKVTGRAKYSADQRPEGMLWGRVVTSKHAEARIKSIDISAAEAMPQCKAVIIELEAGGVIHYQGTPIAAVAATTPEFAEDAAEAIRVEYEVLQHAMTPEQALAPGAPKIGKEGNIAGRRSDGDKAATEAALAECDHVVELEMRTQVKPHVCFETHGVVVDYRGGDKATIYASTQGVFTIADLAGKNLELPVANIHVDVQHMGSGYGSKFSLGKEGAIGCKLARKAKVPVHMLLTRQNEFLGAGNRSASIQRIKAGCKADGKLHAVQAELIRLGGIGRGSLRGQPYVYGDGDVVKHVTTHSVHTNIDGSRAWRAPGSPQSCFGIEPIMDALAYKVGMDAVEFRKKNLTDKHYHRLLDRGAKAIGWERRNKTPGQGAGTRKRGMGCAVATWGGGGRAVCEVDLLVEKDGSVTCKCGTQDLGTGTRTYMAQITAEELGLEVSDIIVEIGRSSYGKSNASGGSTTVPSLAPAVKHAAHQMREELAKRVAPVLGVQPADVRVQPGKWTGGSRSLDWKKVAALGPPEGLSFRGVWQDTLSSRVTHPTQFVEVEVDTETGQVKVLKIVAVQDCGLVLNELTLESQVQGAVIQAMSYALLEERIDDPDLGMCLNPNMEDYKVAGALEIPEIEVILDDEDNRPVVGIGEPPIIPTHAAIANAVYNACGARVTSLPITPDKVLAALEQEGGHA